MPDARGLALEVLVKCQESRAPSDALLAPRLARSGLDGRDRRFVTTLVQTTHRWRGRADRVLDHRLARGVRSLDSRTLNILRLGYVQLFHINQIPPHAAVHTSVDMACRVVGEGKGRLVNRILRGLIVQRPTSKEWQSGRGAEALEGELSHPAWLIERWIGRWGEEETRRICEWNNQPPDFHLRVRGGPAAHHCVRTQLEREGHEIAPGAVVEEMIRLEGSFPVRDHSLLKNGTITLQDESQAIVGRLWPDLECGPVLDLCAAPGTKSSHLAELSPGGAVVAADRTLQRVRRVADTKARLQLDRLFPVVADGRVPAFRSVFPRVLVDAPCSGLGVLRRRPDARWLRCPGEIANAAALQRRLLNAAATLVVPGGWLLYSVCTLEPEETELQIAEFVERQHEFQPAQVPDWLPEPLRSGSGTVRVLPGTMGMEGLFAALFRKAEEPAV